MSTDSSASTFSNDPAPTQEIAPGGEGARGRSVWVALRNKAREVLGLDLRALALFRICLGLVALFDVYLRLEVGGLEAFYTDQGALPRGTLIDRGLSPYQWSLHLISGAPVQVGILFGVHAALAIGFIAGFKTRWMNFFLWAMVLSLHNRNLILISAADILLRLLLFWSLLLPMGARWSVDAVTASRAGKAPPGTWTASIPTLALILQICWLYWFTVALKSHSVWKEGEAVFYALHLDQFARPAGVWLREQGWALKPLGHGTYYWELLGPCLLFIPFKNHWFRLVCVLGFIGFHAGLQLTMDLGIFAWVCIAAWIALLPAPTLNWLESRKVWTRLASQWRRAILWMADRFWWMNSRRAPRESPRLWQTAVGAFCMVYVFAANMRTLGHNWLPELNTIGVSLGLNQRWGMFAPKPSARDGWYVFEAALVNGSIAEIFRQDIELSWEKPDDVRASLNNPLWGKYLERLRGNYPEFYRTEFSRYLVRRWNRRHEPAEFVQKLTVWYVQELTGPDGPMPPRRMELWSYTAARPRRFALPPPEPAQEEPSAVDDIPRLPVEESADISDGGVEQP